ARAIARGRLGVLLVAGVDLLRDHGPRELAEQALERAFVIAVDHEVNDTTSQADVLLPGLVHAPAGAPPRPPGPRQGPPRPRALPPPTGGPASRSRPSPVGGRAGTSPAGG